MIGPFMWGRRAHPRVISWEPMPCGGGRLTAEHDGYRRLKDPVTHRRTVSLDPDARKVVIIDQLEAAGRHGVVQFFHLSEHCSVSQTASHQVEIVLPEGALRLEGDPRLPFRILRGSEDPIGGWISRRYHVKMPITTVVAEGCFTGEAAFQTVVSIEKPRMRSPKENG
jgi:hypothetical protein